MKSRVGLHVRLTDTFTSAVEKALRLELPFFQCFFAHQETGRLRQISSEEIELFVREYRERFSALYLHGSYWINLAGIQYNGLHAFRRELALAKKLSFTHMVLHPGSAKGAKHKQEGIEAFARMLNGILKYEHDIQLVIENTAHANMSIGSDITDFGALLELCDYPEKLLFALDTAHAYVYGYDVGTPEGQDAFLQLVDRVIGLSRVTLLHLNDSFKACGSCMDKHAIPGEGLIGEALLRRFALHPSLASIPILLEPPIITEEEECALLQKVRSWTL